MHGLPATAEGWRTQQEFCRKERDCTLHHGGGASPPLTQPTGSRPAGIINTSDLCSKRAGEKQIPGRRRVSAGSFQRGCNGPRGQNIHSEACCLTSHPPAPRLRWLGGRAGGKWMQAAAHLLCTTGPIKEYREHFSPTASQSVKVEPARAVSQ